MPNPTPDAYDLRKEALRRAASRVVVYCICCDARTTLDRAFRDRRGDHYCPDCQHDDGVCGREHGRVA